MKRIYLLLISALFVQALIAQNSLDILTLSGKFTTPQNYDTLYSGKARESGSFAALTVPIPINKKTIIYNSLNYFYFHVNNEANLPDSVINPINLSGFILRTGLIQNFRNGQSIRLFFAPRFMSDMKGGGMDNLQLGGLAMYSKIFSPTLSMGFGAMYNQDFFGPYIVPIVDLNWQITEKFSLSGLLPIYSKIKYKASEKLTLGISHFGLTMTFGLNDPDYEEDYLERTSIDVSLFAHYNIYKNFYIEGRIGQCLGRAYKQYSSDEKIDFGLPLATFGDNRTLNNVQFEDGMFCELRLIYSIPIPED